MNNSSYTSKIIAIGGAGIKIASRLKEGAFIGIDIIGVDLAACPASFEILPVGDGLLKSFGSGGDPDIVRRALEGNLSEMEARLRGTKIVFIIAGLGGGTASALAPLVGECAAKLGAIPVAFVSMPFAAEGARRGAQARESLNALRAAGVCVMVLPNDSLLRSTPGGNSADAALELADRSIAKGIKGFLDMLCFSDCVAQDFEKIKKILCGRNVKTLFACVEASGPTALGHLFPEIVACPLLNSGEVSRSADHLILSFKTSPGIATKELNLLASRLAEKFGARGEKITAVSVDSSWAEPRIEVLLIGQPDPEIRKKHNVAAQAVAQAAKAMKAKLPPSSQTEFGFNLPLDQRGLFDGTDPNIYRGEDVDVPTYIRRNIRIVL